MKLRNIRYFLIEAISCMFKNRLMTLASIVTVASCTLLLGISYFIGSNLDYFLERVETGIVIIAYIDDDATDAQVTELERIILEIDYVDSITFTSSEEALINFSQDFGDQEGFLLGLDGADFLPRSFDIEVNDINGQQHVVHELRQLESQGISEVFNDQDAIDTLISINRSIRIISLILIIFLAAISTVIIINTIRITVSTRVNEINIMKYVGATDWFIRWPFILEGILIGFIGSIISLLIGWLVYSRAIEIIIANLSFISNVFEFKDINSIFMVLTPTTLLMGIGIGVVGSVTSIRKHLRV